MKNDLRQAFLVIGITAMLDSYHDRTFIERLFEDVDTDGMVGRMTGALAPFTGDGDESNELAYATILEIIKDEFPEFVRRTAEAAA